jgi:hypothetical protein
VKQKINIIIIGLGNSGSSAVQDLLREYSNVGKFRYEEPGWITGELNHFRLPGMIGDQLSESMDKVYPDNLTASLNEAKRPMIPITLLLRRYLPDKIYSAYKKNTFTKSFAINRIQEFRDQQAYYDSLCKISKAFQKTGDYKDRIEIAKNWLFEVNEIFGKGKDFVIHKPIIPERHLDLWPELFKPYKVIFIFREPYDQMSSFLATSMIFKNMPWKYEVLFGMDKDNRRLFHSLIDTTIMRIKYIDQIESIAGPERFLKLDFEGLVNNYELYKSIIEQFLELSPQNHKLKGMIFNPAKSLLNINKFINLMDPSDNDKLNPMKEWYEKSMLKVKAKYCNNI